MFYHCKSPEILRVLLLGSTGISVVNIDGTAINAGLIMELNLKQSHLV